MAQNGRLGGTLPVFEAWLRAVACNHRPRVELLAHGDHSFIVYVGHTSVLKLFFFLEVFGEALLFW